MTVLDRGYTSHEHLGAVGLIHMNGRLYDPLLRRFLNADEHIQDPYNTQCYNKYGYVTNNPLLYNDPNGEFAFIPLLVAAVIGAVVSTVTYVVVTVNSGANVTLCGVGKSAMWGAISGAVTFGIGSVFSSAGGVITALKEAHVLWLAQGVAHGLAQGTLSLCQGGSFKSGFASGALGSFGASAWGAMVGDQFAKSAVGTIAFGALSGGVGAELTDGNFWQGVLIGGMVAGLNHTMHGGRNPHPKKRGATKDFVKKYLARHKKEFFGSDIDLWSENGSGNLTAFGTIHTSERHFYNYLKNGFQIQPKTGLLHSSTMLLMHEYGHFLHAQDAPLNFYGYAMFSSIATSQFSWAGSNWTEIKANTYSYYYFGQPKGWDFVNYPVNANYLSTQTIIDLQNHK